MPSDIKREDVVIDPEKGYSTEYYHVINIKLSNGKEIQALILATPDTINGSLKNLHAYKIEIGPLQKIPRGFTLEYVNVTAHVWSCSLHGSWYDNPENEHPVCPICGEEPIDDYGIIP